MLEKAKEQIKNAVATAGFGLAEIILFGSRARGTAEKDSDWDFMVIIENKLELREIMSLTDKIKRALIKSGMPNDVIIKYKGDFEYNKRTCGNVSYYAVQEGRQIL